MEITDIVSVLTRWLHVLSGIMWVGLLYFYNFSYSQFAAAMDPGTRKSVVTGLVPRALFWFRWGGAYTWITGLILIMLVYYHGGLMFEADNAIRWGTGAIVLVAMTFLLFPLYDIFAKSALGKDNRVVAAVGFVFVILATYLMMTWGGFSFRAYNIHIGAMFGTIMAANVWMRIWPAQKKVMAAVKQGSAPDPSWIGMAGVRSKHNTYLSVPLVWTMLNAHNAVPAANSWWYLIGVVAVGWVVVALAYRKAAKLRDF